MQLLSGILQDVVSPVDSPADALLDKFWGGIWLLEICSWQPASLHSYFNSFFQSFSMFLGSIIPTALELLAAGVSHLSCNQRRRHLS